MSGIGDEQFFLLYKPLLSWTNYTAKAQGRGVWILILLDYAKEVQYRIQKLILKYVVWSSWVYLLYFHESTGQFQAG